MAILGTSGDDTLKGTTGNDTILAGAGNDTVLAGSGHDVVSGGAGNDLIIGGAGGVAASGKPVGDTLAGGAGNDVIKGGADNDAIIGGSGNDTMSGGAGADTFIFLSASDSGVGAGNRDVILDFQVGIDKIGLTALHLTAADIDLSHYYGVNSAGVAYAQLLRISTHHDGVFDMEVQLNTHNNAAIGGMGLVTLADLFI